MHLSVGGSYLRGHHQRACTTCTEKGTLERTLGKEKCMHTWDKGMEGKKRENEMPRKGKS